jgi:hypothetical protein
LAVSAPAMFMHTLQFLSIPQQHASSQEPTMRHSVTINLFDC